ncbi:hypothetical protein [Ahrensia sp. R2A130]|uniref:hypothetical protein n=1 Tax=Ahrensia sp. R2A130 TaxID=744979 RepID=UPI0001E0E0A8|nr:hypothetical protein [Ahrensia sp. R2A130]EFL89332.1 hypothetical protein R2A130_3082 [Ahrensia sp. R2A130]
MTFLKTSLIAGGLFAATIGTAFAADADRNAATIPEVAFETETAPTGLLWKEGRVPFVLERFLKDGHLQA